MNPYKKSESRGRLKSGLKDKEENPDKMSKKILLYIFKYRRKTWRKFKRAPKDKIF